MFICFTNSTMERWRGTQLSIALCLLRKWAFKSRCFSYTLSFFGQHNRPNVFTMGRIMRKFQQTTSVGNVKTPVLQNTLVMFAIVWQKSRQPRLVNGVRYCEMITDFLWLEMEDMHLHDMWCQQEGVTCHTANETIALLREKFNYRVISYHEDVNWPPR